MSAERCFVGLQFPAATSTGQHSALVRNKRLCLWVGFLNKLCGSEKFPASHDAKARDWKVSIHRHAALEISLCTATWKRYRAWPFLEWGDIANSNLSLFFVVVGWVLYVFFAWRLGIHSLCVLHLEYTEIRLSFEIFFSKQQKFEGGKK